MTQAAFHNAILDADRPVPEGLTDGAGQPAGRRFAVYRNNVAVGLTEALLTGFPTVAKLLGERNFKAVAGVYLRSAPPADPRMMLYGEGFDAFLAGFEPLAHIGYLGDVARLDLAMRRSYHAADSRAVDPAALAALPAEELLAARLELAPAVRLIRSDWPVYDIWAYNTLPDAPKPMNRAQDVLITRPEFDPAPHALPAGGGACVDALLQDSTLGAAMAATGNDGFDLAALLGVLLSGNAIIKISPEDRP